jgi:hypothetical protein
MDEMLENRTFFRKQMPEHWFTVVLIAAPQDVIMSSGHIADTIQLHKLIFPSIGGQCLCHF